MKAAKREAGESAEGGLHHRSADSGDPSPEVNASFRTSHWS
ncbi:hypothetical protein [Azospirillum endophyticum]